MIAGARESISIRQIVAVTRSAVATEVGLVRSATIGTATAAAVATGIAHRPPRQIDANGRVEYGWSTAPTVVATGPNDYLRREMIPGATGTRVVLVSFDETLVSPITVEPTGSTGMGLMLRNVGSGVGGDLDLHITWEVNGHGGR